MIESSQVGVLNYGRWGNALVRLCRCDGEKWVIKDFEHCPPVIRDTWGVWMVARELRAFERLRGIKGIPRDACRIDRYALAYRFEEGRVFSAVPREETDGAFFLDLERTVREMHARNLVHLDLRYRRNIIVTPDGHPCILDFQSHIQMDRTPDVVRNWLVQTDLSGVYKHWCKRSPETMGRERLSLLWRHNRHRRLWRLKGYGFQLNRKRRQQYEQYVDVVHNQEGMDVDESTRSG
jgi:RIO-like serine/threonine protein kinase